MGRRNKQKYELLQSESCELDFDSDNGGRQVNSGKLKLKRNIGTFSGVSLVVSMMIGSGIFVVPTGVLKYCEGDVILSMVVWAIGGIFIMAASLCICELGASIPHSGSWMTFLHYSFGPFSSFVFTWITVLVAGPEGFAAQIIALGEYMTRLHFDTECDFPNAILMKKLLGMLVALIILVLNITRVKWAIKLQVFSAFGKVMALLGISLAGFIHLMKDNSIAKKNFFPMFESRNDTSFAGIRHHEYEMATQRIGISGFSLALYQGLWAYDGFDAVTLMTEEVKNPKKALPTIMLIAVPIVTILYLIVNAAYFSVLTPAEMLSSQAVAVTFGQRIHPFMAYLMTLSVCSSLVGSINANFLAITRVPFVAGRLGHMPEFLSMAHVKYYSPVPAILLAAGLGTVMLFPSNFDLLVTASLFTNWGFRALAFAGIFYLRHYRKDMSRPYKVYTLTAVLVILFSTYLVVVPLIFEPEALYLLSILLIVVICGVYLLVARGKLKMTGIGRFGIFLQKLLQVSATASSAKEI